MLLFFFFLLSIFWRSSTGCLCGVKIMSFWLLATSVFSIHYLKAKTILTQCQNVRDQTDTWIKLTYSVKVRDQICYLPFILIIMSIIWIAWFLGLAFLCSLIFFMSMVAGISRKCINSHFNQGRWLFGCALDYSDFHICLVSIFFFMLADSWYLKVGELIFNSHICLIPFFFPCYQIRGT